MNNGDQQIVPGLSVSSTGQATVALALADVIFDLALKLDETMPLPVDVQHVLAAIVLAARNGELDPNTRLSADAPALVAILAKHVTTVFAKFDGNVGMDD